MFFALTHNLSPFFFYFRVAKCCSIFLDTNYLVLSVKNTGECWLSLMPFETHTHTHSESITKRRKRAYEWLNDVVCFVFPRCVSVLECRIWDMDMVCVMLLPSLLLSLLLLTAAVTKAFWAGKSTVSLVYVSLPFISTRLLRGEHIISHSSHIVCVDCDNRRQSLWHSFGVGFSMSIVNFWGLHALWYFIIFWWNYVMLITWNEKRETNNETTRMRSDATETAQHTHVMCFLFVTNKIMK